MKILCPECGFRPFDASRCTVDLADPHVTWDCECGTVTERPTVPAIAEALAKSYATVSVLPDPLEREARAFAVALEDSYPAELWAAIEATRSNP